jgi:hypothetical protein
MRPSLFCSLTDDTSRWFGEGVVGGRREGAGKICVTNVDGPIVAF